VENQAIPWMMLLVSIMLGSVGQIMLKIGMKIVASHTAQKVAEAGGAAAMSAVKAIGNPWVFAGFVCYGISSILWLIILKKTPLSTAYPMISMGYIVVVVLSALILREPVRWTTTLPGLLLIVGGVSLIGLGMGGK
jgi:multidrug transporter EmrE-like cation transporter